ncbi:IS3 family transposase [Gallibacterium salpingitidis]|nr:IS3 family transposase [Gallibacterium salpingitidis]
MTKYTQTFKQHVIDFYVKHHECLSFTCRTFNIPKRTLRRWIAQFRHSGSNGLAVLHTKRTYSPDFKYQVIQTIQRDKLSLESASLHFGIANSSAISQWLKSFQQYGIEGLLPKPKRHTAMKKTRYAKMPPPPKTEEERLRLRILELETENAYPKKVSSIRPRKSEEKAAIIQGLRVQYPLTLLLVYAELARSTFFYHLQGKSKPVDNNKSIKEQIIAIKRQHPHYGYRRVTRQLDKVNHKRVQRLLQELGLQVKRKPPRKYSSYQGQVGKIAPNRLQRDFRATHPNQKWLTDITEFNVNGEKLYFSPILDCYNNELIAYQWSRHPNSDLVNRMVRQAITRLSKGDTPILHSDQGIQYQIPSYQHLLVEHHIVQSMSRKGNCLDNAAMESFFGRMKVECFYGKVFQTIAELEVAIKDYVRYYNEERIQLKLNGLSPVQYRLQSI